MSAPVVEISGLQLSNNTFSASPPGSLSVADNVVIKQKGVAEPRNGQAWNAVFGTVSARPWQLTEFQAHVLVSYSTTGGKGSNSYEIGFDDNAGNIVFLASASPVDSAGSTSAARMHFALASLFCYFCTSLGPRAIEAFNFAPRKAGLPRMPDLFVAPQTTVAVSNGWMPYNSSVAYRTVLKRAASSGQSLQGPPSNRSVVTNRNLVQVGGLVRTGGTTVTATFLQNGIQAQPFAIGSVFTLSPGEANFAAASYTVTGASLVTATNSVVVTWASSGSNASSTVQQDLNTGPIAVNILENLPDEAVAGDTVQFERSLATSLSTVTPGDDMYLAAEHQLNASDISSGFCFITDNTPQTVINIPLYTSPTIGEGLTQSNFAPPIYRDIAEWSSQTFYVNTTGQQSFSMEMLGVGGPAGVQNGDTLNINDTTHGGSVNVTFTFKTTPSGTADVQLISSGTPSYNIQQTTNSLSQLAGGIPLHGTGIKIYQNSGVGDFPGKIIIERSDYGPAFDVNVSRPTSWTPGFATVALTSDNNRQPNQVVYSKLAQPEAVPAVNFTPVGAKNYAVRRAFGLRNALIICKEGDGIWSLTGAAPFNLQQISLANIIAPDCACVFADCVWVYTDQGILKVSDTGGCVVVSRPIEVPLNDLLTLYPQQTYDYAFAVAYETERRVMFYVPVGLDSTGAPILEAFCYSNATSAWTRFNYDANCAVVTSDHHLYAGINDTVFGRGRVTVERKTGTYLDKADADWSNTLTTTANPLVVQLATAGAIVQGTGITQGNIRTKVAAVLGGGLYQLAETFPWANGACTISDPFPVELQFLPTGDPITRKVLTRLANFFRESSFANYFGVTTIKTDQVQAQHAIAVPSKGFGSNPFGQPGFGDKTPLVVDTNPISPKYVNAAQFYFGLKFAEAWLSMRSQGIAAMLDSATAPVGRGK